ncbi:Piso0_002839 [Millerozyma farinosa CBS 7064]|uniref:Serine/threonine-protein phosphatase 4 regulatory subunit 3 n=1 Tax=Pichia sorbitophila (strain ATCC MYA-4447 / BCRC 22081 / CBS 7064 / NBRC 10061 / NRRL Y-12695) TaxID=559304 RepID=G8YG42_PICSO|nr:Piso0_002839 [Millerozyma farinosa CBS 7064]
MASMTTETTHETNKEDAIENDSIKISVGRTPRRVKVYLLQGEDWIDSGTGYCIGEIEKETNKPYFIVRNELDSEDIILKSFLEGTIQYQRQQETLIVWTDLSGKDLALSFQETEGCADLCEFIIKVQQEQYSPEISLYYVMPRTSVIDGDSFSQNGLSDITELITGPVKYPELPETNNLEGILDNVCQGLNSQFIKSCIINHIIEHSFLSKFNQVFAELEKARDLENLHLLSEIIKTLILYNEVALFEEILAVDEIVYGIVGMLEYSQEFPNSKACYRDILKKKMNFKTVIELPDEQKQTSFNLFKRDFYLSFLKDVVLARFIDDQTMGTISSLIYFNHIDIINFLKDPSSSANLLQKLFRIYDDDNESKERKRDGVKLLHQYIIIAKSLQSYQIDFFSALVKNGLFSMIRFAFSDNDSSIRVLGTELVVIIIEQDITLVNTIDNEEPPIEPNNGISTIDKEECQKSVSSIRLKLSDDMTLIKLLTKLLIHEKSFGLKIQAFEALRILLGSNIASSSHVTNDNDSEIKQNFNSSRNQQGTDNTESVNDISTCNYFNAFYAQVAPELFRSFKDLSDASGFSQADAKIKQDQILYEKLCDLISFCVGEHSASKPFIIENGIIMGIAKILELEVKTILKLSALRCLKCILFLNDDSYAEYILDNGILKYFMKYFMEVSQDNNLANSSCLQLLEMILRNCEDAFMYRERQCFQAYGKYLVENYREFLANEINYVKTGKALVQWFEENKTKSSSAMDSDSDSRDTTNVSENKDMFSFNDISLEKDSSKAETSSPKAANSEGNSRTNLFEGIEKSFSSSSVNGEKRHREDDDYSEGDLSEDADPRNADKAADDASIDPDSSNEAFSESHRLRKRISTSLRKRLAKVCHK